MSGKQNKITIDMEIIAHVHTDLPEKFGIPRQSGLAGNLRGEIVFEPKYRDPLAVRGMESFQYIWILWQFDKALREGWTPTVRPPRLGGNTQLGVFATRSPFRPNHIGLSSVRLERIEFSREFGPILHVSGIDMRDGTPVFDIKPYLKYADSHEDANDGFAENGKDFGLQVNFPKELAAVIPEEKREGLVELLAQDPRPAYHKDSDREYGVSYAGFNVRFKVDGGCLFVIGVE